MNPKDYLDKVVRPTLIRLEDSIIFDLFEREQFKTNKNIYIPGGIEIPDFDGSFLDFLFRGTEELHAKAGRYVDSKEHAFFDNLPDMVVKRKPISSSVKKNNINVNQRVRTMYLNALQKICEEGDDETYYGASAVCDIRCLQDLSRRVHYGTSVAESKFQIDPEDYSKLISEGDIEKIRGKLRNIKVEQDVLERVRKKGEKYSVEPQFIEAFFRDKIIPLTIDVEVEYFMQRGGD